MPRLILRDFGGRFRQVNACARQSRAIVCARQTRAISIAGLIRCVLLFIITALCAGCASDTNHAPSGIAPDRVSWCSAPDITFEDDGTSPSTTIKDWPHAQSLLGFTPLLPPSLPAGACLAAAGGVVRNPTFGGRFIITYELPDHGALSLAESPRLQEIPAPQCSTGAGSITTCRQTQTGLDITISSTQSAAQLRSLLGSLRADAAWVPRDTPTPTA